MATTNTIIETLTDTTYDSVEGYRKAAETAKTPALKQILTEQGNKRQATLDKLNAELQRLGGNLVTKGTAAGELHHLWVKLTSLFENGDEAATERVEEGETYLAKKFEEALENDMLDPMSAAVVREAHAEILAGKRMAEQLENAYDD